MRYAAGAPRALAALVAGCLVALSLPPFGLWPLAVVGVAVLAVLLRDRSLAGRAGAGMLAGIGQFVIGLAWADKFTFLGYGALVVLQSAMFALACALAPPGRGRVPALAGLLTLAEVARESWPFGGVPPGGIALGQLDGPLVPTARVGRHRPARGRDLPRRRSLRRPRGRLDREAAARPRQTAGPPAACSPVA